MNLNWIYCFIDHDPGLSQSQGEDEKKTFLGYAIVGGTRVHNTRKVKMESITGKVINLSCLYNRLQGMTDRRKARGKRYALATILPGMFLAKPCGEDKPSGIAEWVMLRGKWILSVPELKRKSMPSHHTYRRSLTISLLL